jgi:hypothetical protein
MNRGIYRMHRMNRMSESTPLILDILSILVEVFVGFADE